MRKLVYLVLTAFIISCLMVSTPSNNAAAHAAVALQGPPAPPSPPLPPPLHPKSPPRVLHKVDPTYPPDAREKGVQGTVVLHVVVDKMGQPEAVRVMSGDPLLTPAAVDAVRQWRWQPVVIGNRPVTVGTKVTVRFKLDDKKKER